MRKIYVNGSKTIVYLVYFDNSESSSTVELVLVDVDSNVIQTIGFLNRDGWCQNTTFSLYGDTIAVKNKLNELLLCYDFSNDLFLCDNRTIGLAN